jgi:uncharacterized protein (UPF0335 family)
MPNTVREAWGEVVAHDFAAWLEDSMEARTVGRAEWSQSIGRIGTIEHDVADLKHDVADLKHDVADLKHDVADLKVDLRELRREMNERFDRIGAEFNTRLDRMNERMASQMRWSVGLLAVFGTTIAILVGIGQLAPLFRQ